MKKQITINLGNIGSKEQAYKIRDKIQGKTYYDFRVEMSPYAGNWGVSVWTEYPGAKKKEVREMLMFVMACEM